MYIIAGLGNPTKEYDNTRHNIGFAAIDALADKYGISVSDVKNKALMGKGVINGNKVMLLKPLTYMNLSGEAIRAAVDYYKIDEKDELIVIYDDISEKLKTQLGTKVNIVPKEDGSGKIEIEFYSHDELDRILDLMK